MTERDPDPGAGPRLFTPGPTQLPASVRAALQAPLVPARTPDFMALMASVAGRLREVFHTSGDVITLTASGSGAMEAAFVNLLAPGERILVAHAGKFGERWLELARAHGVACHSLALPWGQQVRPGDLARGLREAGRISAVFLTHSETSTGVVHDVAALARVVREHGDALVVVDAVSSAGAIPLHVDDWQLDACVSASHKGLLCPPGLSFVALGPRARERVSRPALARFYFDLRPALDGLDAGGTPWTPAVSLVRALDASLQLLADGGLERAWARTRLLAAATRAGVHAAGLGLFANPPGDVVTAALLRGALDARKVVRGLRERGFEIAPGQSAIKREVFRIAHLGSISDADLLALLDALKSTLADLGAPSSPDDPARAARAVLDGGEAPMDRIARPA